eukprot:11335055-Ditylum_brightwellii.AAC.1
MEQVNNFLPKKNISLQLGKATVYVYPHFTAGMPTAEKAFGFMVIKSALKAADLTGKARLQSLGDLTSTTLLIT